jgi:hypothetical protein
MAKAFLLKIKNLNVGNGSKADAAGMVAFGWKAGVRVSAIFDTERRTVFRVWFLGLGLGERSLG